MRPSRERKVFVIDDEVKVLEAVGKALGSLSVEVTCFVRPSKCLGLLRSQKCDLLIADLKMPEMDGIEFVTNVQRYAPWVPVLVMTEHGDVPGAVRAMKAGAIDLVEKPLEKDNLIRTVESILQEDVLSNACVGKPLTAVQTKVLKMVIDGKSNKEIADLLDRSVRTIEVHRAHMMERLGVSSLLELVKRAAALGLVDLTAGQKPYLTAREGEAT
ncbi:MAG: response regulator transcription factor [Planctomycetota bacterium]|jgi:two-component system response regulator FixJ